MKELIKIFGSPIKLYNRIKDVEKATKNCASVSYVLPDERRFLINIEKLKALCFDQIMENNFSDYEIAVITDICRNSRLNSCDPKKELSDRIITVLKLLKE